MRTREVAEICGVSIPTITENAKKVGIVLENGKIHDWTEDELKKVQAQLMNNTMKRGSAETGGKIVESTALNAFKGGLTLQELIKSGNVDAMIEFNNICLDAVKETARAKQLEAKNQQLQLEVDKYTQWMSASQIKKEYNLPTRPGITTVALELGLERGKDWIERQYDTDYVYTKKLYSPEAVDRIVDYFFDD